MEENDGRISFADLGINNSESTRNTCLGKIRSLSSLSKLEIAFLVISLSSLVISLGITIERLATVDKDSAAFTFALVLLLNIFFCIYYVLSGVFLERPCEIGILVLATGIVWLYLLLNIILGVKGPYKLVRFENKSIAIIYFVIWITMPVYGIFLVVKAALDRQSADISERQKALSAVTFVAVAACIAARFGSLFFGLKAFCNFKKGLRQKVYGAPDETLPIIQNYGSAATTGLNVNV